MAKEPFKAGDKVVPIGPGYRISIWIVQDVSETFVFCKENGELYPTPFFHEELKLLYRTDKQGQWLFYFA